MAAERLVVDNKPTLKASTNTTDVKHVLFKLETILDSPRPNIISELTVPGPAVGYLPTKSSSEILSELFSAFNAEPPNIPENYQDVEPQPRLSPTSSLRSESFAGGERKHKEHRTGKKHKHKNKKHLKKIKKEGRPRPRSRPRPSHRRKLNGSSGRPRHGGSSDSHLKSRIKEEGGGESEFGLDSHISSIGVCVKKEKVNSNSTRPRSKHSKCAKDPLRSVKRKRVASDPKSSKLLGLSIKISNDLTYDRDHILELIPGVELPSASPNICADETSALGHGDLSPTDIYKHENIKPKIKIEPGTEPTEKQPSTSNSEECITVSQTKNTSKISIKSLKFSSVFEATVREVEEQAKAKADKYEEGELSNSDSDELVLSPISSIESDGNPSTSSFYHSSKKKLKKCKKRHRSESGERSSKHYHSSKCRKNSKSESESKFSGVSTSTWQLKRHSRHEIKSDNEDSPKKIYKRQYSSEKHDITNQSTSKSPICKFKKNADKNVLIGLPDLKRATLSKSLEVKNKIPATTSGRKTVEELTNFCKRLSKKEQGCNRSDTEGDEDYDSDSETEQPFHHPFQVKERPQSIIVNIRNSIQLPVKSLQEKAAEQSKQLRVQFPVSSGQRHRKAEDEWVLVPPRSDKVIKSPSLTDTHTKSTPAMTPVSGVAAVKDIGSIVTQKLRAMRTLQENPNDVEALGAMFRANQDMLHWAEAKQNQDPIAADTSNLAVTGQTASSQAASTSTPPSVVPVCSGRVGMGMSLLQKMGWKPGEGLGKNREGVLEPLKLEIKMDKKGLITAEDFKASSKRPATVSTGQPTAHCSRPTTVHNVVQTQGKHPINKLVELCARKRWRGPQFELCYESGPDHRKNFLFKVLVNGTEYKPMVSSLTKKQAKTEAASICLQAIRDLN